LSTSASGVAVIAESSGFVVRQESESALIFANYSFPPRKLLEKISASVFIGSMNFGSSDFSGKFSVFFKTTCRRFFSSVISE